MIKLYSVYTDDIRVLKDRFVSTIKDNWELNLIKLDTLNGDNNFGSDQFIYALTKKSEIVLNAIKENLNTDNIIIVSDLDIQFFGPCTDIILSSLNGKDIIFQREWLGQELINGGFIVIRPNERTLRFYENVILHDFSKYEYIDQGALQEELLTNKEIKWGFLPVEYFYGRTHAVPIPDKILYHHATCTGATETHTSLELKMMQLNEIKIFVENRKRYSGCTIVNGRIIAV